MQLRTVRIHTFRNFVDQELNVDATATALVGRNDSGKTGLLTRLIDQHFFERVIHGSDRSRVPGPAGPSISFDTLWQVSRDDYRVFPLESAFGRQNIQTIETRFRQGAPREWEYLVDGRTFPDAYATEGGRTFLRSDFSHHALFPHPHYLNVGDQTAVDPSRFLVPPMFEAQFSDPAAEWVPMMREHQFISTETLLLRIAGFRAATRNVTGRGIDEPWGTQPPQRSPVRAINVQRGLDRVAERLTAELRRWWRDPEDLTLRLRISDQPHSHEINSFLVYYEVLDRMGLPLSGSGLRWFVSFAIQLLHIQDSRRPLLLLLDEPATPLHPGAQQSIVRMLNIVARQHQLLYTTHSPFMLDWSFPQRIRVFERDSETRRTRIINKPYVSTGSVGKIWDPLRGSIGTTMGGIITLGEITVFVEGISDQIILANVSEHLAQGGRDHFDFGTTSIIPYTEELSLKQLIRATRAQRAAAVVLTDTDEQGEKCERLCRKEGTPVVRAADFAQRTVGAIEDVIGIDDYIRVVNEFYSQFSWFTSLDPAEIGATIGAKTLGRHLELLFGEQFSQSFSKTSVSIALTEQIGSLSEAAKGRLAQLISYLIAAAR